MSHMHLRYGQARMTERQRAAAELNSRKSEKRPNLQDELQACLETLKEQKPVADTPRRRFGMGPVLEGRPNSLTSLQTPN